MAKIFLSYRTEDPVPAAMVSYIQKLWDEDLNLGSSFSAANIEPGEHYKNAIEQEILSSDIVLVLIGAKWLHLLRKKRNSADEDMVVFEIDVGLKNRKEVVPVLMGGEMPDEIELPGHLASFHFCNAKKLDVNAIHAGVGPFLKSLADRWKKKEMEARVPPKERQPVEPEKPVSINRGDADSPEVTNGSEINQKARNANKLVGILIGLILVGLSAVALALYFGQDTWKTRNTSESIESDKNKAADSPASNSTRPQNDDARKPLPSDATRGSVSPAPLVTRTAPTPETSNVITTIHSPPLKSPEPPTPEKKPDSPEKYPEVPIAAPSIPAATAPGPTLAKVPVVMEGKKAGELRRFGEIDLIWCPPTGEEGFSMGFSETEQPGKRIDATHENYRVILTRGFWLARTECTQAQWESVMVGNPSYFKGETRPVELVDWDDVQGWLTNMNKLHPQESGWKWSLPSEAQWEYACRAGKKGDTEVDPDAVAWFLTNADSETHEVGARVANAWGLHDMRGNVSEYTSDFYRAYPAGTLIDPKGLHSGDFRIHRGGSWTNNRENCRADTRLTVTTQEKGLNYLGFRPALLGPEKSR